VVTLIFVVEVPVWLRGTALVVTALLFAIARILRPEWFAPPETRFEVDDDGVRRLDDGDVVEQVRWDELVRVVLVRRDEDDDERLYWLLVDERDDGCAVPDARAAELRPLLERLPGFDHSATEQPPTDEEGQRVCWEGEPGDAAAIGRPAVAGD